jgi:cyclic pyranopterin phosphate synthase
MIGIDAAKDAGLIPVKINCVIIDSPEEKDARSVTKYCLDNNLEIRYIRQMDLVRGHFSTIVGGIGGNCALCNRLRLTSDGKLKPCLFNDISFDIREMGYDEAIKKAVAFKPESGSNNLSGEFYNIGG